MTTPTSSPIADSSSEAVPHGLPVYGDTPTPEELEQELALPAHESAHEKKENSDPIANIAGKFKDKIFRLLGISTEKPSTPSVVQRVMNTVNKLSSAIMNIFSGTPETKKVEPEKTVNETQTLNLANMPKEVQKAYEEAENYHREQTSIMEKSFAKLSNDVSPGLTRDPTGTSDPENLNNLALQRLKTMKRTGIHAHDIADATKHGYAENISAVFAGSGKEILQDFMDSEVHRRNVLGFKIGTKNYRPHNRLGVAIDVVFDKESGEYMYYVVALYKGAEDIEEKDKQGKPVALDPVNIPDDSGPKTADDITSKYFNALALQIQTSGSKITHSYDTEGNKTLNEKERLHGSFKEIFTDDSGRMVTYLVSKHPPTLTRVENGKNVSVLFPDVLNDFAKALDERSKPKIPPASPTPKAEAESPSTTREQKPTPGSLPTAAELKQQFAMQAAMKQQQQMPNPLPTQAQEAEDHAEELINAS